MKILAVDIGTGTQDIFLYDSRLDVENGFKLVLPSPTMIVHRRLKDATRRGQAALLHGVTMGGGPSGWAAEAHVRAGLSLYATPQAARSFNDDLSAVQEMGILVIGEEEALRLPEEVMRLELRDFDFALIRRAFQSFGVSLDHLAALAVAVFDHGDSPPGYSDRQFRFDYLDRRIREYSTAVDRHPLSAFAYRAEDVPPSLTRLRAVVASAGEVDAPLVVMDTAPAAVWGATFDPQVAECERVMIANIGNFHTLAFRLGPHGVEGVFEHHTGLLDAVKLNDYLRLLADSRLKHADVFADHGHGALIYDPQPLPLGRGDFDLVITGPRRSLFKGLGSDPRFAGVKLLSPYFAVPFGDMMLAGCFGLLAAAGDLLPEYRTQLRLSLSGKSAGSPSPWDLE